MVTELPSRARVVIIGGGIVGASVAYHLTKLGWTDLVLVEQGHLSGGTTWHAAGLLGQLRATHSGTQLVQYSAQLYADLEAETGLATGFTRCGGLTVARTPDRLIQLQRTVASGAAFGIDCELITPAQAKQIYPLLRIDDLLGAIWLPGDGTANPSDVTASLARGARNQGARIFEQTRVTGIDHDRGEVRAVTTDHGRIECEVVVNCAGQWAKAIGALCGVPVPLHSAEHFYAVTDQIEGLGRGLPILRDPDGYTYFKAEVGGLVVGGFEPAALPWRSPDQLPYPFEFQLLADNLEHFGVLLESAQVRIPVLESTGIKKIYNGPESFTPDNQFILGQAPELRNFYVAAGFNSVGIASAGGAGRALAEWIDNGEPTQDLTAVDIRRFAAFNGNTRWLRDRVGEVLGLHYEVPWPNRELHSARPFRPSPVYDRLARAGASFGAKLGWERANVFAPTGQDIEYSWQKPNWLAWSAAEQRATRTGVAVFDETSFGKLLIKGPEAEALLQWLCTADVAVRPGTAVYTGMLNARGGYEADVTVTRIGHDEYLLVTSAGSPVRDLDWITRHRRADQRVSVTDVSGAYAVFGVMGPSSRQLLQQLTQADLSDAAFPFARSQVLDIGYATARATRLTYVGELGWELYVPTEFATSVYDELMRVGAELDMVNAGYYTINSMRLEKGYRAWPAELTPDHNPVEAGLSFACKLATDIDFLGRPAVEAARSAGVHRRLASFVLADPEVMLWGGELIRRDGSAAGLISSAAWGETLGACVGLGYVTSPPDVPATAAYLTAGRYQVDVGGRLVEATLSLRPPFDPDGTKIKA